MEASITSTCFIAGVLLSEENLFETWTSWWWTTGIDGWTGKEQEKQTRQWPFLTLHTTYRTHIVIYSKFTMQHECKSVWVWNITLVTDGLFFLTFLLLLSWKKYTCCSYILTVLQACLDNFCSEKEETKFHERSKLLKVNEMDTYIPEGLPLFTYSAHRSEIHVIEGQKVSSLEASEWQLCFLQMMLS